MIMWRVVRAGAPLVGLLCPFPVPLVGGLHPLEAKLREEWGLSEGEAVLVWSGGLREPT